MADPLKRHPDNAAGPWFVDTTCIDCDAARQCAPTIFGERGGQSVVVRQPETAEEILAATRGFFACPTGSIGAAGVRLDPEVFPEELADGVYYTGFNARRSFGANAYFVRRPGGGNLLVDAPRWVPHLRDAFEAQGGIAHVLLTHRDDVADADRYAKHFGARVWIHEHDRAAAPFASDIVRGRDPTPIADELVALPVPGHTRGSVAYLLEERFLFSGDSLYWSRTTDDLGAFDEQCWYSWDAQIESLARLAEHRFERVLPGHGGRGSCPATEMRARLVALTVRMRDPRYSASW